ncbi:MAG TPA: TRAP transporter small permease subunit [Pseudomonadales bacterium]|nr:TRAP transporter small permease subunit [Pseudomonadales bacterium]
MLLKLENAIHFISDWLGKLSAWLLIALLLNVFYDVIMRYLFNDVSIGMQEMEWHLYSAMFLFGISYCIRSDGNVRVDVFYERWQPTTRAWVNIFGCLVLLLPFTLLVVKFGWTFTVESYQLGEQSGDPGGLPYRWIIKGAIPLSFSFMCLSGVGMLLHNINILRGEHRDESTPSAHLS